MILTHRPFDLSGSDFEQLWRMLQQNYHLHQEYHVWMTGRLGDWKYGLWNERKYFPTFYSKYAQVWVDGFNQVQGAVLSEDGSEMFTILTLPGCELLYPEILDWTVENWRPRFPQLGTEVHERQYAALEALHKRGFRSASAGPFAITRAYDLARKGSEPVGLPDGFHIEDIAAHPSYHAKRVLQLNAFRETDQVLETDLLAYEYSRQSPAYDPAFDLSVVAADGRHASSCLAFIDLPNQAAEVERVCTHSDFRRQGLAEAVIRACFQRLARRGIRVAYITGYSAAANAAYEKLGPYLRKNWYHYAIES